MHGDSIGAIVQVGAINAWRINDFIIYIYAFLPESDRWISLVLMTYS